MTLRERFDEIGVPQPEELGAPMNRVIKQGLSEGRILCIITHRLPDDHDGSGRIQNVWSFLAQREDS